jgi:hypothetical protein
MKLPSPAMIVALIALFVALGGTSYAVTQLPRNSVGTPQIKNNAITGTKVKDRSLSASDFAAGSLPAGPAGPAGPQGPKGDKGDRGSNGLNGVDATRYVYDGNGEVVGEFIGLVAMNPDRTYLATRIGGRNWKLNSEGGFIEDDAGALFSDSNCTGPAVWGRTSTSLSPITSDLTSVATEIKGGTWHAYEISRTDSTTLPVGTVLHYRDDQGGCVPLSASSVLSYARNATPIAVPTIVPPLSIGP